MGEVGGVGSPRVGQPGGGGGSQRYQKLLDDSVPHRVLRWALFGACVVGFMLRVYLLQVWAGGEAFGPAAILTGGRPAGRAGSSSRTRSASTC